MQFQFGKIKRVVYVSTRDYLTIYPYVAPSNTMLQNTL